MTYAYLVKFQIH